MDEGKSSRCLHCGEAFAPRSRKLYCTRTCKQRAASAKDRARKRGLVRTKRRVRVDCRGCGITVDCPIFEGDVGRYCSSRCFNETQQLLAQERRALRRIADSWKWRPGPLVIAECQALRRIARYVEKPAKTLRPCTHCGTPTIGRMGYRRTCSDCARRLKREGKQTQAWRRSKRIYRAKRRALERGVQADKVDPFIVFERDGWRCHMCGCKTPKNLRGTYESNAPELDHVLPLAVGGTHTWGNVACACRKCNIEKADRPLGQLGLPLAA